MLHSHAVMLLLCGGCMWLCFGQIHKSVLGAAVLVPHWSLLRVDDPAVRQRREQAHPAVAAAGLHCLDPHLWRAYYWPVLCIAGELCATSGSATVTSHPGQCQRQCCGRWHRTREGFFSFLPAAAGNSLSSPYPCSLTTISINPSTCVGQVLYYEHRGDAARAAKVSRWLHDVSSSYRLVQLLALVKPSVAGILRSEAFGLNVTKIPVPRSYPGWRCGFRCMGECSCSHPPPLQCLPGSTHSHTTLRTASLCLPQPSPFLSPPASIARWVHVLHCSCRWMWIGDSVATLVGDGVQLALLVWTCTHFKEPFLQIGVRESQCCHLR